MKFRGMILCLGLVASGCQATDEETKRSKTPTNAEQDDAAPAQKKSDAPQVGTTEDSVSAEQNDLAAHALNLAEMPKQSAYDSLKMDSAKAKEEPSDEQLSQLIAMAKENFPELANAEFTAVDSLVTPSASLSLSESSPTWTVKPRKSYTGYRGGQYQSQTAESSNGTKAGNISGTGPFGNFGSAGAVANPNVGAAGYVFGWIPGYGVGIAVGGIGVDGSGGGGYCGISVDGAGCGSF